MATSGQLTASTLEALLQDGKLTGAWILDPSRSRVSLKSRSMWGMAPVKGVFGQVSGQGTVSSAGEVTGTISVAAASVDTKVAKRDTHLRSADFFDAENHPSIVFDVQRITPASEGVTVTGTLTVRERTQPLSFAARVSSFDGDEVWLDADARVNRKDFGLTWNQLGMASMNNTITIHAVFTRQA
jgi:polyisoprenoid-binding protein YceI